MAAIAIPTGPVKTVKAVAKAPMAGVAATAPVVATAIAPDIVETLDIAVPIPPISFPLIIKSGPIAAARAATFTIVSCVAGLRFPNHSTACCNFSTKVCRCGTKISNNCIPTPSRADFNLVISP